MVIQTPKEHSAQSTTTDSGPLLAELRRVFASGRTWDRRGVANSCAESSGLSTSANQIAAVATPG